ncbi:SCO family protein [Aureimonas leprariae]|uniref:SCO family protein n=1 Tax=Plantimonas leprariae TaxID=2615207 RepID=A0A7V7PSG9_9HYPH|nr:SCO family protein [Aureimonas leprariae]
MAVFRLVVWAAVALFAGAALAVVAMRNAPSATASADAPYGTPFQLADANGAPITEKVFQGKPTALFFGFTNCPEVCPTTLSELGAYREELKKSGKDFQIVFVTVDPDRDTFEVLKNYVGAISPDVVAITGPKDRLEAMLKGWGVYWKKVGDGPDYTMDHTATTFLLDARGSFAGTIAYDEDSKTAKEKLERLAATS